MQLRLPFPVTPSADSGLPISAQKHVTNNTETDITEERCLKSDDPFFICNLGKVVSQVNLWRELLPRVLPFYAVKCNDDPVLLQLLSDLGLGFDCASKGEIALVTSLGIESNRIIYANPCKQNSHIKFAAGRKVNLMTFDSEGELFKIKRLHPDAMLVLRIATDDSHSVCQLGMKFGAPQNQWKQLLSQAAALDLDVVGVSFHVGSGCLDANAYETALKNAAIVFSLAEMIGYQMNLLDIGGGFPGFQTPQNGDNPTPTFKEIADVINASIDRYFSSYPGVTIIAEPGRYFAAAAFTLAANVISVKQSIASPTKALQGHQGSAECERAPSMLYINDGVYGSFNCLMYDHAQIFPRAMKPTSSITGVERAYSLWGPSCDGLDKLCDYVKLPEDMAIGDWLVFDNMGAYTSAAASCFNGFPKPTVHYIISPAMLNVAKGGMMKPFSVETLAEVENDCEEDSTASDLSSSDLNFETSAARSSDSDYEVPDCVESALPVVSF